MEKCRSFFKPVPAKACFLTVCLAAVKLLFADLRGILMLCICCSCSMDSHRPTSIEPVVFGVLDVGEGLSQIIQKGTEAVLFDVGPEDQFPSLKEKYFELGRPLIKAIVLSHDHIDHIGALRCIDSAFRWSGIIYTSCFADTQAISGMVPPDLAKISIVVVGKGDTLVQLLNQVSIRCLWPPKTTQAPTFMTDDLKNRFSLVFKIERGAASALITADIDSIAMQSLFNDENKNLSSEIFIVPHHGSEGSVNPVFYGFVHPLNSIISCSATNFFHHPSALVLTWLSQMGSEVALTSMSGDIFFENNGFYWIRK